MAPLDRQHQTEFSAGRGNALQACAASLLERPLDEVPNFITSDDYWAAMLEDAAAHGLTLLKIPLADGRLPFACAPGTRCVARGGSPRGDHGHVVVASVGRDGRALELAHDPFPDGGGLAGAAAWAAFYVAARPAEVCKRWAGADADGPPTAKRARAAPAAAPDAAPGAAPGAAPSTCTLFAYAAEGHEPPDGLFFVELKRPALKGCDDISRYVSWFRVSAREAERLQFVSWSGDVREFAQGVLTTASEAAHFEFGGERITLEKLDAAALDPALVAACVAVWPA